MSWGCFTSTAFNGALMTKLFILNCLFLISSFFHVQAQETEEDLIFCGVKGYATLEAKLTKTNDKLYTFYLKNNKEQKAQWEEVMTLDEPIVWTKKNLGEVADFYSYMSYGYRIRLTFDNSYVALGDGEFILPQTKEQQESDEEPQIYYFENCKGQLK